MERLPRATASRRFMSTAAFPRPAAGGGAGTPPSRGPTITMLTEDRQPPQEFVTSMRAYDPRLRARWSRHMERWLIEEPFPERAPAWLKAKPRDPGEHAKPAQREVWESWSQGYLVALMV